MKHGSAKSPHSSEHKIQLVQFLVTIGWGVGGVQQTLQKVAKRGHHGDVRNGRDFLEAHAQCVQADGDVLVKQDLQVGFL